MRLLLKSLSLKNFKGVKNFTLTCRNNEVKVYGANATGKTTLKDAFMWLLFDKDSQDRSKFSIQPLDSENNIIHNLETEVEVVFLKDNQMVTLTKKLIEKWTRPKGQNEKILSGTETIRYIDGVPVKETEYKGYISEIVNQAVFKLISNPYGFENEKWQFKRELLFHVCGSVEDSNIPEWNALKDYLGDKSIEMFKKSVLATKKKLKTDIDNIPPRIDELTRTLEDEIERSSIQRVIDIKEEHLRELKEKLESNQSQFEFIRNKQKELLALETTKNDVIRKAQEEATKEYYETKSKINEKVMQIRDIQNRQDDLTRRLENARDNVVLFKSDKEVLYKKYDSTYAETFDEHKKSCQTCGQIMPQEMIENLVLTFETSKAEKLNAIKLKGQSLNKQISDNEGIIITVSKELEELSNDVTNLKKEAEEQNLSTTEPKAIEVDTTEIDAMIAVTRKEIETFKTDDSSSLKEKIKEVEGDIGLKKLKLSKADAQDATKIRIKELAEDQKDLACKLADCEKQEFLVEQFTRSKVDILVENINSKFKNVKFKLFNPLVNGGIEECCESLIDGVPFSNANTASQYAAGIEIINVLCKHYDFYAPIWLDGRESVTEIPYTNSQVINLIVCEKDKELRVQ